MTLTSGDELKVDEIVQFPTKTWDLLPDEAWLEMCDELHEYEPPQRTLKVGNKERKWELVSSYQKSMRRGDLATALRMVSAMDSMPDEWGYFHKRIATTFCEDIGPAAPQLVLFAIACMKQFTPKKLGVANYRLFCYLTAKACQLKSRSRLFCSYSIIENALKQCSTAKLPEDFDRTMKYKMDVDALAETGTQFQQWCLKNNWRGEGMLKYLALPYPLELEQRPNMWPPVKTLFGLPNYAYDMHTRVGSIAIAWLTKKLGLECLEANKIVGYAVFFHEGGRIMNELFRPKVSELEQEMVARKFSISREKWNEVSAKVNELLGDGVLDQYRDKLLRSFYPA